MKSTSGNHDDFDDQDDGIDMSSNDELEFDRTRIEKEKHINIDARRKIESYLEDKYLENQLKDIFFFDDES